MNIERRKIDYEPQDQPLFLIEAINHKLINKFEDLWIEGLKRKGETLFNFSRITY